MKIDYLKAYIPEEFIKKFKAEGIKSLYPAQAEAIKKGILKNKNLIISTPTASGKTLIATLAIIKRFQSYRGRVVYIVPLVALAQEKYQYYKEFFKGQLKVALSVGDLDSQDPWLNQYQLIIATSEKLDSLMRHGATWIDEVNLIIADEIHLLNDASRGPTLEVLLTLLRKKLPKTQVLGLSATINNAWQLSQWLNAELIESAFRPVKLYEGVCFDSKIKFIKRRNLKLKAPGEEGIVQDTVHKRNKQLLIFVATRRSSESLSERIGKFIFKHLNEDQRQELNNLSQRALHQLERPTRQCQRLAFVLKNGVAFHHAGLLSSQKSLIEDNFRKGLIKVICATPTLALGVNLPAFRVLIRDIKRYYPGYGALEIPVLEYKQFAGRAGRPQYDKFGEAVLLSQSSEEAQQLIEKYILGKPEDIESKLAQSAALSIHCLSLIASGICLSLSSLLDFFALSFFGFQYKDIQLIEEKIKKVLRDLVSWGFVTQEKDKFMATLLGRRISQLYLNPQTAYYFLQALYQGKDLGLGNLGVLQIICYVDEIKPLLRVRAGDLIILGEIINRNKEFILMDVPLMWDENYQDFLRSMKTALCLEAWINETTEDELLENFQIAPGELHNKLEIADWLIYCLIEIATLLKEREFIAPLKKLRIRLNYGVKEELLSLVTLREIGRVRSRRLFNAGIRDAQDLRKTPQSNLATILGPKVALRVREQLLAK